MNISSEAKSDLLALLAVDLEITKSKNDSDQIAKSTELSELRNRLIEAASEFTNVLSKVETIRTEIEKVASDLNLVETRIAKDQTQLLQTSSPKDAQGIQSELATLARRKDELEDAELNLMDELEQVQLDLEKKQLVRDDLDTQVREAVEVQEKALQKIASGLVLLKEKRAQLASRLAPELFEAYERKARRSVPVGLLQGRECTACRMTLGATSLEAISATPQDQLIECPECQAILIRE